MRVAPEAMPLAGCVKIFEHVTGKLLQGPITRQKAVSERNIQCYEEATECCA